MQCLEIFQKVWPQVQKDTLKKCILATAFEDNIWREHSYMVSSERHFWRSDHFWNSNNCTYFTLITMRSGTKCYRIFFSIHFGKKVKARRNSIFFFSNTAFQLKQHISCLSDCSGTRTHNYIVRKRTLNHLAKLPLQSQAEFHVPSSRSESCCSHLNFRHHVFFEEGVPWHLGKYRVWIHFKTLMWHEKNIQTFDVHFIQTAIQCSS